MAGTQRTEGEKERKNEAMSLKPQNANAFSAVSPVEEACLKLQQLTMGVCLCQCSCTKATVVFFKGWHQEPRLVERKSTLLLLSWPADGHMRL